ncbi:MAG: hypothetical protein ACHQ1H_10575 [Nitrososphaerales archaeon]
MMSDNFRSIFLGTMLVLVFSSFAVLDSYASSQVIAAPVTVVDTTWAGYGIVVGPTATGKVTGIFISFKVPAIKCSPSSLPEEVGIKAALDGVSSSDHEFVAVLGTCQPGATAPSYSGIASVILTPSPLIKAGQIISESVKFSAGVFLYSLEDLNTTKTSTGVGTSPSPALNAGTCYVDRPPSSLSSSLPLADFGKLLVGKDNTKVPNTCYATGNGKTLAIGSFAAPFVVQKWVMDNAAKTKTDAIPGILSADKSSFSINWKAFN